MDPEESKEIVEEIIQELDKILGKSIKPAIHNTVTIFIPYKYAERLAENAVLRSIEMSLLRLFKEREKIDINRVRLHLKRYDLSLIEVTLMR